MNMGVCYSVKSVVLMIGMVVCGKIIIGELMYFLGLNNL